MKSKVGFGDLGFRVWGFRVEGLRRVWEFRF